MTRLIRAEIYKLRKRSMTYILLSIMIGFIVLILSILAGNRPVKYHYHREYRE